MHILLIGGTGFIGTNLSRALVTQGHQVVSLSLSGQGNPPGVIPVAHDLTTAPCPPELIQRADIIIVLIGQKHPAFQLEQETAVIRSLAQSMKPAKARVIYLSSTVVYGNTTFPATESTPYAPLDSYADYKVAAEKLLHENIPSNRLLILRLANIYGAPGNKGFIGLLFAKVIEQQPAIMLTGDGEQQRDYVFLDDLIHVIIALVNRPKRNGTINIATGTSYSLKEVVKLASEVAGYAIAYEVTHQPINEAQNSWVDNNQLRKMLENVNFTPLRTGLALTFERYQEMPK